MCLLGRTLKAAHVQFTPVRCSAAVDEEEDKTTDCFRVD